MQNAVRKLSFGKLLRSVVVAVLVLTLFLLVVSVLISEEVLPMRMGKTCTFVSLAAASAVGSGLLVSARGERKMQTALINAGALLLILVIYALAVGRGSVSGDQVLLLSVCVAAGSITGGILTIWHPLRKNRR